MELYIAAVNALFFDDFGTYVEMRRRFVLYLEPLYPSMCVRNAINELVRYSIKHKEEILSGFSYDDVSDFDLDVSVKQGTVRNIRFAMNDGRDQIKRALKPRRRRTHKRQRPDDFDADEPTVTKAFMSEFEGTIMSKINAIVEDVLASKVPVPDATGLSKDVVLDLFEECFKEKENRDLFAQAVPLDDDYLGEVIKKKVKKAVSAVNRNVEDLNLQVASLEQRVVDNTERIDGHDDRIADLTAELDVLTERLNAIDRQLISVNSAIVEQKQFITTLESQIEALMYPINSILENPLSTAEEIDGANESPILQAVNQTKPLLQGAVDNLALLIEQSDVLVNQKASITESIMQNIGNVPDDVHPDDFLVDDIEYPVGVMMDSNAIAAHNNKVFDSYDDDDFGGFLPQPMFNPFSRTRFNAISV